MSPRAIILGAAVALVSAFVCPLAIGASWFFGPTLLTESPPGLRILALIPGLVGPIALLAALKLRPVPRAALALLAGGVGVIGFVATIEALTAGQAAGLQQIYTHGALAAPGIASLALFCLVMAAAFTGLALARRRPDIGPRIVGFAGAALLVLHLAPLGERTPLDIVRDGVAWKTAWPIPTTLLVTGAFAAVCMVQLFEGALLDGRGRSRLLSLARLVGLGAVLILPVALVVDAAARSPGILGFTATVQVKFTGAWIALYALVVGGALGLVDRFLDTD